jgi:hypothetical protein
VDRCGISVVSYTTAEVLKNDGLKWNRSWVWQVMIDFNTVVYYYGLVVFLATEPEIPGSIPGATRFNEK